MSSQPVPYPPQIRSLSIDDLDRVMEIEHAAYPYPWTRGIFEDCIRVGYDCHGLFVGGRLIGYAVQLQAANESHLLNLCVDPQRQRVGYGSLLLDDAIRRARARGCRSMFLEVRPSNGAGIALYQRSGFRVVGTRKDYYRADQGREDAVVMRLQLDGERSGSPPRNRDPF